MARRAAVRNLPARFWILLLLAALPRFAWLSVPLCDLDESWSWYHVKLIWAAGEFWRPVSIAVDAPLFPAINLVTARLLGHDIGSLRVPPAIFGTLSVPLCYLLVRRLASETLAWRTALLMAVSPFFVYYSKDARPYAQLLFTCLFFTWAFFATERMRSPARRRVVLAACTLAAVASHYYALVYLASFYGQRLWHHHRAGRRAELRDDFTTGVVCFVVVLPLVLLFLHSFERLSLGYWTAGSINLATVVAEQWFFTGSLGAGEDPNVLTLVVVQTIVFALLMVPALVVWWRGAPRPVLHPLLASIWLWSPGLMQACDLLFSRKSMFLPRGFLPSAPFLLTWWFTWSEAMPVGRRTRRIYQGVMLVPVLLFAIPIATSSPDHAAFKYREVITEIVDQIRPYEGRFGTMAVHFWWMAQYYAYHYEGRATVEPIGMIHRELAHNRGEMAAVMAGVETLPRVTGVLYVENALASKYFDPEGQVLAALDAERPRLAEPPCHPTLGPEVGLYCTRMVLFGPAREPSPP